MQKAYQSSLFRLSRPVMAFVAAATVFEAALANAANATWTPEVKITKVEPSGGTGDGPGATWIYLGTTVSCPGVASTDHVMLVHGADFTPNNGIVTKKTVESCFRCS